MYTKVYRYKVQPDKKEQFLDVHQEMADIFLDAMGGRIQFMRNMNDESEWIVVEQLESKQLYDSRIEAVKADLAGTDLMERLNELLLVPQEELTGEDFFVYMEVSAEN